MRKATALLLGTLLALLGLSGTGQAQSSVQVQGTIQAVDCQAQTVVLSSPGSLNTIAAVPYTAVLVNSTSVPFCALERYIGASATAWLLASGSEFVATRIDVIGQTAVVYSPAVAPATVIAEPLPIEGIILGTIIVAGLLFLLARDDDDHFYRYPYYGPYHRYYYRPEYRPYLGAYPPLAPVITVPQPVVGSVLGTTVVGGFEYMLVRDRDGRLARYPYFGPYHRHYYKPEYRPYHGQYHDAPVRQGDVRWDAPVYRDGRTNQGGPETRGTGILVPLRQSDPRWNPPVYRDGHTNQGGPESRGDGIPVPLRQSDPRWNPPVYRDGHNNQGGPETRGPGVPIPMQQSDPRWSVPPRPNDPAYTRPNWNPPASQNDRGRNAPRYREPYKCSGWPNQQCSDDRWPSPSR